MTAITDNPPFLPPLNTLPREARKVLRAVVDIWLEQTPVGQACVEAVGGSKKRARKATLDLIQAGLIVIKHNPDDETFWLEMTEAGQFIYAAPSSEVH